MEAALSVADVIAAQVMVQLGLVESADVRTELQELAADPHPVRDLVNRLSDADGLDADTAELVRHRVALYMHVWSEDSYLRHLEQRCSIPKEVVADMLIELERSAYRRRLGAQLVRHKKLSAALDASIQDRADAALATQFEQALDTHRANAFRDVTQPLIEGSDLDPADFKISKLFRSRRTIALVDDRRLAALRIEAKALDEEPPPAAEPEAATLVAAAAEPAAKKRAPRKTGRLDDLKHIGEYDVVEVLGVGGMGAVYLCQDPVDRSYCALKVLLGSAASATEKGRFQREIELTARIRHRNVIALLDSGTTEDGLDYMVVPSLFGKELRHYLRAAEGGLPPDVACQIFEQLLSALQACHEAGVVHRDLKPENVFVLAGGKHDVRLLDFGVAKYSQEELLEGSCFRTLGKVIVGTPAYMSPDAITNDKIDGRTDLYSLGIMLFEMLTGQLPLTSPSAQGFIGQHLICPPSTLAEACPERAWPEELEELLASMLAKGRKKRPESCAAILAQLDGGLRAAICEMDSAPGAASTIVDLDAQTESHGVLGLLGRLLGDGA